MTKYPNPIIAIDAQPQNTVLVCTGLSLPNESQEMVSISGQTNFIPTYCPMNVPKMSQKAEAPRYQITIFLSSSGVWIFIKVFFFSSTIGLLGAWVTLATIPLVSLTTFLLPNSLPVNL